MGAAASAATRSPQPRAADPHAAFLIAIATQDIATMEREAQLRPELTDSPRAWHTSSTNTASSAALEALLRLSRRRQGAAGRGATVGIQRDSLGRTPLMAAAAAGAFSCCRLLLDVGADPWAMDSSGLTALHLAATAGHAPVAELLLEAAAEGARGRTLTKDGVFYPDFPTRTGLTALHLAAAHRHADMVALLLRHRALPSMRTHAGTRHQLMQQRASHGVPMASGTYATPLHIAAVQGDTRTVRLLMSYYIEELLVRAKGSMHDPRQQRNGEGRRPLDLAPGADGGRPADAQLLALLDPGSNLPQLMPDVARGATAIRGHRRIDGAVPTLQMLAAAALGGHLAASAAAATKAAAAGKACSQAAGAKAAAPAASTPRKPAAAFAAAAPGTPTSSSSRAVSSPTTVLLRSDSASSTGSTCSSRSSSTCSGGSSGRSSSSSSRSGVGSRGKGGAAEQGPPDVCGICTDQLCAVRSTRCQHGVCGPCASQLCKQVTGKLMPLACPYCRTTVAAFTPL